MGITIEFNPTTGTVKITSVPSAEAEAATLALAQPTVQGGAQNAGPDRGESAHVEGASVEGTVVTHTAAQPAVQGGAQNAGAYRGESALMEGASALSPRSTTASSSTPTGSTPTPTIIDEF